LNDSVRPITILTSGVGLGIYIPALLIRQQLNELRVRADVEVVEEYYSAESQAAWLAHKEAFQTNFALAVLANRMARPVRQLIDSNKIRDLMERWAFENRNVFVVWSGYWLPILDQYKTINGNHRLDVDLCRIDAEISASFRAHPDIDVGGNDIWLWNWHQRKILREIPITHAGSIPIPFGERERRLIVHGGGWGLGTYRSVVPELERTNYALDVVVNNTSSLRERRSSDRRLIIDPDWQPWQRGWDGRHSFPAVGILGDGQRIEYQGNADFHEMYNVLRHCRGIISKPGGGTLIDSLNSGTPVVFLDAFGDAEQKNAALWEYLGYGVSYQAWRDSGYSESLLEKLHSNIIRRKTNPLYPQELAERLAQQGEYR
jgi:hypothetical protein